MQRHWDFGVKAHIGAANVADVTQTVELLHGEEAPVHADAGYAGAHKREEAKDSEVDWAIAEKPV